MDREIAAALFEVLSRGVPNGDAVYEQAWSRLNVWADQQPAFRQYVEECQTGWKPEKKGEPEARQ
jgi:hypothetical protein